MLPEGDLRILIAPTTQLANSSATTAYVDTKGWDFLTILGSDSEENKTAASKFAELRLSDTPTVPTAFADGTAIVAFEGGTAVDATHGFVIPTASTTVANGFIFKVDLRKRRRYVVMELTTAAVTDHIAAYALLSRAEEAPEAAITTTTLARARVVIAG